jgi:hypothetical protein
MAGLVPAIHDFWFELDVDARDKRGHDESNIRQCADYRFALVPGTPAVSAGRVIASEIASPSARATQA